MSFTDDLPEEFSVEESVHMVGLPSHKPKDPRTAAKYNIFSRLLLIWVDPLFWLGCHRTLEQEDIYAHPREADSEKLLKRFNRHWRKEMECKSKGKKPWLLMAVCKCFWPKLMLQGVLLFSEIAVLVIQSVLLGYLADLFADTGTCTEPGTNSSDSDPVQSISTSAYYYATGLSVIAFSIVVIHGHSFLVAFKNGMISRIVMTGAIYQKVLSLSQVTVGQLSIGHIVNLASNDVQRLDLAFIFIHIIWIAPLHLGVVTYLIYLEIGWYTFIVTGIVCVQVPLQVLLARLFNYLRLKSATLTDSRVRIMNEVITGIRVIKMYTWEYAFKSAIRHLRQKESTLVLRAGFIRGAALAFMIVFINIVIYITFTIYTATGGELSAKKVFTTISLLINIRLTTVHFFIQNILGIVEARVASVRLQKLLELDEFTYHDQNETLSGSAEISARNMTVSWTKDGSKLALSNISFTVDRENRLLAVVGPVGSGKSTLLQSLLNELQVSDGNLNIKGQISYASQDPWIFSASLRENVTFGREFKREHYDRVLKACALDKDVKVLVNGDLTLVGERGVTLSGGQKARVNLARAVYRDADIYLLDDPLSAVDAGVGKHIFNRCIQELLRDKLVVLTTHQVHFAILANKLLILKDGEVEAYGSYASLLATGFDTARLLGLVSANEDEQTKREPTSTGLRICKDMKERYPHPISPLARAAVTRDGETKMPPVDHIKGTPILTPRRLRKKYKLLDGVHDAEPSHLDTVSISSSPSMYSLHTLGENIVEEYISQAPEESEQGTLSTMVYVKFFQAGGTLATIIVLWLLIVGEVGIVLSEWWLSNWALCEASTDKLSSLSFNNSSSLCSLGNSSSLCSLDTSDRIYIYTGITVVAILANFARALGIIYVCVNASRVLHNRMFLGILRSPVLFFDTNPTGRILNRFSKDVGFLDDLMPYLFCEFVLLLFRCLAIFLTTLVTNRWVILPAAILFCVMLFVRWYFLKTSREVKRIEALARSPVYSHLSTTLQGLPVIRAFRKQDVALNIFHEFQNQHTQSWYIYLITTRWLGMRVDMLSALFVTVFIFMSIGLESYTSDVIGLGLTYAVSLSGLFQYMVRQSAEIENLMVSGERVMGYGNLEPEAALESDSHHKPPDNWPDKGNICAHDVSFQYAPDLPLVLHDISFSIKPSEKVGIVGRTGAGKSSLISVLYRLAEFVGQITIDGVDIQTIGLHDLRKNMSIIPQDPVLFSGTVRYNLDPFEEYTDMDLWKSLEQVQLSDVVEQMEGQLNSEVLEGGGNFSVGQRQLVCLARALLRKNKIMILDEATANVDPNTDRVIQEIICDVFADCTVLTIAHRLNTIMDSDRVLVMKDGQVGEFDTPLALLKNKHSQFAQMVEKTGDDNAHRLYQMAFEANKDRS